MGGTTSPHYLRFRNLCSTAFANLRKNANLILNLVALMVHSGVQDIKLEPDAAVGKVSPLPQKSACGKKSTEFGWSD